MGEWRILKACDEFFAAASFFPGTEFKMSVNKVLKLMLTAAAVTQCEQAKSMFAERVRIMRKLSHKLGPAKVSSFGFEKIWRL